MHYLKTKKLQLSLVPIKKIFLEQYIFAARTYSSVE